MAASKVPIGVRKLTSKSVLRVQVRATRELAVRTWIATMLFSLGARVLGCGFEIKKKKDGRYGKSNRRRS